MVSFTITGTNDAPTITAEASTPIDEVTGDSSAQDLSDTGLVSFDDLDTTDVVDITFASDNNIAWSGGALDSGLASALVAGFSIPATTDAAAPGSVTWSYDVADADLDFLAAGETITFSYTLTATDSQGATATDVVSFTITGTNDAPVLNIAPVTDFVEAGNAANQSLTQSGVVDFADSDVNNTISVDFISNNDISWTREDSSVVAPLSDELVSKLENAFTVGGDNLANEGQVNWQFNAAGLDLDFLNANDSITFSYTVSVTDSQGASASEVVTITLKGTNDAPEMTDRQLMDDETIVQQGADFNLDVSSLFSDKDSALSGENLDFNISGLPQGLAYDVATGVISGKPTQPGPFTINVTAIDASGATLTRSFSMTVTAVVSNEGGTTGGGSDPLPEAPQNDTQPVDDGGEGSGLPGGLVDDNDSSDPTDGSGFLPGGGTGGTGGTGTGEITDVIGDPTTETGGNDDTPTDGGTGETTGGDTAGESSTDADSSGENGGGTDAEATGDQNTSGTDTGVGTDGGDTSGEGSETSADDTNDGAEAVGEEGTSEEDAGEASEERAGASDDNTEEGSDEVNGTETIIMSEPGALVIQTQTPDGNTTLKASVDVNVDASGQVVFTDVQQEAFSTVSLAVASIDVTADNQVTIDIQDTSPTASTQQYSGSLGNGESLPSWIQLDPATGTVMIDNPPVGQKEVVIRIQAMGSDGQLRVLELKLDLEELLKRTAVTADQADEVADEGLSTGFVPLNDQLETELAAREQYGDRLLAMLHSV